MVKPWEKGNLPHYVQLGALDVLHRRMLRAIVGWVRNPGDDWAATMRRMNKCVECALKAKRLRSLRKSEAFDGA